MVPNYRLAYEKATARGLQLRAPVDVYAKAMGQARHCDSKRPATDEQWLTPLVSAAPVPSKYPGIIYSAWGRTYDGWCFTTPLPFALSSSYCCRSWRSRPFVLAQLLFCSHACKIARNTVGK